MSQKRKAFSTLEEVKKKLRSLGSCAVGKKSALVKKLSAAEELKVLVDSKDINGQWDVDEVHKFVSFLPADTTTWDSRDTEYVHANINTRASSAAAMEAYPAFFAELGRYIANKPPPKTYQVKELTVTADSLMPMMTKLSKNAPEKWGVKEIELLVAEFRNVNLIDGSRSSMAALEAYQKFLGQLADLYADRPDVKALLDPEVVIFDISGNVDSALYQSELAAYRGAPASGPGPGPGSEPVEAAAAPPLPAHFDPLPEKWNAGPVPIVFPMPSAAAAYHFIAHMRARVPHLRALLLPDCPGPAVTF